MAQRELNAKNWEHMHTRGMRRGNTDDVVSRAEHRPIYGIRPYTHRANTVTGTPVTVTV
jgi:hypothetical protein